MDRKNTNGKSNGSPKTESSNEIKLSYANLLALEKRIEALESQRKACSADIENLTEINACPRQSENPHKCKHNLQVLVCIGAKALVIILIGVMLLGFYIKEATIVPRSNMTLVIGKNEWLGEPQKDKMEKLQLPVQRVIIAHVGNKCESRIQCDEQVRSVQAFHIHSNGWNDIGFNFLVGGDGLVYEGRGWYKQGAHTMGYNRDSICIAFIGTFNLGVPTENDLKAAQLLIAEGVRLGVVTEDYRLYGARQLSATESPGIALYRKIMTWPHWSSQV